MKYIMALLAIFLIACGGGSSEAATSEDIEGKPYLGMSAFAIMHPRFPCDKLIEFTSKIDSHPAISVLWGTFGDSTQCLSRWLQSQSYRPHLVQIHFSNEVCRRKSNCAEGEFFGDLSVRQYDALVVGDSPAFKQGVASRMDEILTTINKWKNPFTKVVIGMGLEDQYSHLAALKLYDEIDRHTDYEISRNPLSYNASAIAPIHELHGVRPPLQSLSLIHI